MRKDLLERVRDYSYPIYKRNYLESLLNLELSPFGDIKRLNQLDMNSLEKEIIKYNLSIKAINAINKSLPDNSKLRVLKSDNFSAEVSYNHDWPFIDMCLSDNNSKITYYDRTSVSNDKKELDTELEELEEEYHHTYGVYYGSLFPTEEETKLKTRIEDIKNILFDISLMEEDKEIFEIDKVIKNDLLLPSTEKKLINNDDIYEPYDTYDVTNNSSIKVYKKVIRKK